MSEGRRRLAVVDRLLVPLLVLGVAGIAWEAIRRVGNVDPLSMPPVVDVLARLRADIASGILPVRVGRSLGTIAVGLVGGTLGAALLGATGLSHRVADRAVGVVISLLHPLPAVALVPVLILWVGIGRPAVIAVVVHAVVWPMATGIRAGLESVPPVWTMVGRSLGMGRVATAVRIALPGSAPLLLASLRIAWARAWRAAIAAEMLVGALAGSGGLGAWLFERRMFMDPVGLFAALIPIAVVGSVVEIGLLSPLERRVARWWETP